MDFYASTSAQDVCDECHCAQELQCKFLVSFETAILQASLQDDESLSHQCAKSVNSS